MTELRVRRREFVAATIGALATANPLLGAPSTKGFCAATIEDFRREVGSQLSVRDPSGRVHGIELISAVEGRHMPHGFRRPISLLLRSRRGSDLQQDVYEVSHPGFTQARLLVVPVARDLVEINFN